MSGKSQVSLGFGFDLPADQRLSPVSGKRICCHRRLSKSCTRTHCTRSLAATTAQIHKLGLPSKGGGDNFTRERAEPLTRLQSSTRLRLSDSCMTLRDSSALNEAVTIGLRAYDCPLGLF